MRGVGGFRGLGFSIYVLDLLHVLRAVGGFRFLGLNVYVFHYQLAPPGVDGFLKHRMKRTILLYSYILAILLAMHQAPPPRSISNCWIRPCASPEHG